MVEIQPLKTIHEPNYPQKENVSAADLKASIPKRWVTCSAAKIALGTLAVMSLVGCSSNGDAVSDTTSTKQTAQADCTPTQVIDDYATEGEVMVPMISVAPLFVHGEGRGTFGCIMVAPPVFMSEDEALVIINEVAKEYGLEFSDKEEIDFHEVIAPVTYIHTDSKEEAEGRLQRQPATFVMDFADKEHNIALEYVSVDDVWDWNVAKSGRVPQKYHTQDAAEQLTQGLEFAAPDTFDDYAAGVLYDPCTYPNTNDSERHKPTEEERENARDDSISDLKQQVKDFFEWLRIQGVI